MDRPMDAFLPLHFEGTEIWVDRARPVAVLRRVAAPDVVVGWPDLVTGWAAPAVTVVAAPGGVWVHYGLCTSVAADDPLAPFVNDVDAPAVHIDAATGTTSVVRVGREHVLGATRHGLWTTGHSPPDPDPAGSYRGEPLPADWRDDSDITVRAPDGSRTRITVDRSVLLVQEVDDRIRLVVRPSPAIAIPGAGGSVGFEYRSAELGLPADRPLPALVRFRDLVPAGWGSPFDVGAAAAGPQHSTMSLGPVVDAPQAEGEWRVADPPDHVRRLAIASVAEQFEHLEHYWHPEDGSPGEPLTRGLRDAVVTVDGDFPRTRVRVEFSHSDRPGLRVRRTVPVFDAAGRMLIDEHSAIWLMEDLDTGGLPPAASAVDGVLHM